MDRAHVPVNLKKKLASGELAIGSWIALPHPGIAEMMCHAGFDWVAVDLEHSTMSLGQAEAILRVVDALGRAPLVRLTTNDPPQIKRVMDAGAHGIIVPNIRSVDELARAHRAMHYPPRGDRGVGLARAQGYGAGFPSYVAWLASSAVLVAQIEHVDAMAHLAEILAYDDLDAFMVGPYDLSASMGIAGQFEHPDFVAALAEIRRVGEASGKPSGIHVVEPDTRQLRARVDQGFRFVAYSVDFRMIDAACRDGLRVLDR